MKLHTRMKIHTVMAFASTLLVVSACSEDATAPGGDGTPRSRYDHLSPPPVVVAGT